MRPVVVRRQLWVVMRGLHGPVTYAERGLGLAVRGVAESEFAAVFGKRFLGGKRAVSPILEGEGLVIVKPNSLLLALIRPEGGFCDFVVAASVFGWREFAVYFLGVPACLNLANFGDTLCEDRSRHLYLGDRVEHNRFTVLEIGSHSFRFAFRRRGASL